MNKLTLFGKKLLKKVFSREFISYGVFGLLTTAVNILLFQTGLWLGITYSVANLIALFGAKLFAYVTNKLFVFRHRCENIRELLLEIARFVFARGFTALVDFFGLLFAVEVLCCDEMSAKLVLQVIVVLLNYILSKKVVFPSAKQQKPIPADREESAKTQ